ncbi:MAG: esterase-like activity of phytase family protein [Gemmataceae bacterium]|nr:esterase-like activity of phytase family protein [Gemmataceae bacterium]
MTRPVALAAACLLLAARSPAAVELVGVAALPGTTADRSGLAGAYADGTPKDRLGGLSGIAHTGRGDDYLLLADRGPKDGASDFACRFHRATIRVTPKATPAVSVSLAATVLFTDEKGRPLVGSHDALHPKHPADSLRFDPEGIRVGRGGSVFVSDEYGPVVFEFDPSGKLLRRLPVPTRFLAAHPAKAPADELPPKNTRGRVPNRGLEGLAITPDGARLVGMMQGPLLQDGALDAENKPHGRNVRLLDLDVKTERAREVVYVLDAPTTGVSEVVAVDDREFLVLERDGKGGPEAAVKRLYRVDLAGATDVGGVDALPAGKLPANITPVTKRPFLDLLDPRHGIAGPDCPEKFEGLAFGPDLPDGRRLLLVTADNDFVAEKPVRVYAFAAARADLPRYAPQQFDPAK